MTATTTHPLIADYLRRLDVALADVPSDRRREIRDEITQHIDAALEGSEEASETDILNLLDRLGDPKDIALEARDGQVVMRTRPGALEIGALILLPIGAFIVPVVGWFAGVILLWISDVWSTKDKLIGTLLLPGGLALPAWLVFFVPATGAAEVCSATEIRPGAPIRPRAPDVMTCTTDYTYFHPALGYVVLGLAVLIPIATVIYLGVRSRRARVANA